MSGRNTHRMAEVIRWVYKMNLIINTKSIAYDNELHTFGEPNKTNLKK